LKARGLSELIHAVRGDKGEHAVNGEKADRIWDGGQIV
jgi:hypothetical protein